MPAVFSPDASGTRTGFNDGESEVECIDLARCQESRRDSLMRRARVATSSLVMRQRRWPLPAHLPSD